MFKFDYLAIVNCHISHGCRIQSACGTSGVRHSFNTPASYSQSLHMESGIYFQKPSQCPTKDAMSMYEVPLQYRSNHDRMPGNADTRFKLGAILQTSYHEQPKLPYVSCSASEFYLQALRDFLLERRGVLGDGWHVEFDYCPVRCKTSAIYCAPDGRRFGSMSSVADCLGFVPNGHALEADSRGNGVTLVQKGNKRKEVAMYLGADTSREVKNVRRSILGGKSSPSAEVINADVRRSNKSIRPPELDKTKIDDPENQKFYVSCAVPVSISDLAILSWT